MKKWLYSVVTTVALFLLAALGFARPNSPAKSPCRYDQWCCDICKHLEINWWSDYRSTRCLGEFSSWSKLCVAKWTCKREIRPLSNLEMALRSLKRTPLTCWIQVVKKGCDSNGRWSKKKDYSDLYGLSWKNGQCDRETAFLCACRPPSCQRTKDTWIQT